MVKTITTGVFQGTVKDFVESGLMVNGEKIDAVGLSVFGRYKMLPVVGEQKPARGRSAAVYEIDVAKLPMFSL